MITRKEATMKKGMILWCVLIVWISALGLELLPARALARTPYDVWFRMDNYYKFTSRYPGDSHVYTLFKGGLRNASFSARISQHKHNREAGVLVRFQPHQRHGLYVVIDPITRGGRVYWKYQGPSYSQYPKILKEIDLSAKTDWHNVLMEVRMIEDTFECWLNGKLNSKVKSRLVGTDFYTGGLGLYAKGTEVEFRDVKVRELCIPAKLDVNLPLIVNIWTKKNFQGEKHTLIAPTSDFSKHGMDGKVGSLEVIKGPNYKATIKIFLFTNTNFRGGSKYFYPGKYPEVPGWNKGLRYRSMKYHLGDPSPGK